MRAARGALVSGVVMCALGLLALVLGWGGHAADLRIRAQGGRVPAQVTGKLAAQPDDWTLDYRFELPDGQRVDVRYRSVSQALWQGVQVGDRIEVRDDPRQPQHNFPAGEGKRPTAPLVVVSVPGGLFVLAGAGLVAGSVRRGRAETEDGS